MSWPGAILTDSGGFQVFSLADLRKVTDDGVVFRSHLDGSEHFLTPEKSIEIQQALGSDIAMVLDECIEYPAERDARGLRGHAHHGVGAALPRLRRLSRGARRARCRLPSTIRGKSLFAIVQGGTYADLRRESARQLVDLDFPGLRHRRPGRRRAARALLRNGGRHRGANFRGPPALRDGRRACPSSLPDFVRCGMDMMDCVLPTRNARNGCLFTSAGRINIKNAIYADDPRPLDERCSCMVCRTYSRAYLRHLFQANEILASILNSHHNVAFFLDIMSKIRQAIAFGELAEFSSEFQARIGAGERDGEP